MQYVDIDADDQRLIDEATAVIKKNYAEPRHSVEQQFCVHQGKYTPE